MARRTNQDRIINLLLDERDGLSSVAIKERLNLSDKTYDRERERLLIEGIAQKKRGRGGGLKLTQAFLNRYEEWLAENAQQIATGSGFFVSVNGHLMTNYHVIEGCKRIIVFYDGARYEGNIVAEDSGNDLALIKIDHTPRKIAVFRPGVRLGEDVGLFGFPLPELLTTSGNFSRGSITGLAGILNERNHFQIQAPVQGGNSGGPVVDASGKVIGIVASSTKRSRFSVDDMPENTNFAIRADVAYDFAVAHHVAVHRTSKPSDHLGWIDVAMLSQAMSALIYCDEGFGDIPDVHPPEWLVTEFTPTEAMRWRTWPWLSIAALTAIFVTLFAFKSQLGF